MIFLATISQISEMKLSSSNFFISPTLTRFPAKYSGRNQSKKILGNNFKCLRLTISSKKSSSYQDFQEYAKPWRLLPAGGMRSLEKALAFGSLSSAKSESLYAVRLRTSNAYGSGLSDVNSAILLCLIDENGSSILQCLPATSWSEEYDTLCFQRGSIDEFAFEGPHLGRIVAVWIGLESGQWRINGMTLRVISPKNQEIKGLRYDFELDDILLGEKGEASMMEFKPHSVTAFSEDQSTLFDDNLSPSPVTNPVKNEESMEEYMYLKFSLLCYDVVLILACSAVASVSMGENAAYALLIAGLLGFAYLLLVQKSVDELPAPDLIRGENEVSGSRVFGSLKGSVSVLVLVFAVVAVMVKYASGEYGVRLVSRDIIFGMMGFLMCKVAIVLAAFKPMRPSLRDNE